MHVYVYNLKQLLGCFEISELYGHCYMIELYTIS
jgi:hypothetical protein